MNFFADNLIVNFEEILISIKIIFFKFFLKEVDIFLNHKKLIFLSKQ